MSNENCPECGQTLRVFTGRLGSGSLVSVFRCPNGCSDKANERAFYLDASVVKWDDGDRVEAEAGTEC